MNLTARPDSTTSRSFTAARIALSLTDLAGAAFSPAYLAIATLLTYWGVAIWLLRR